MKLMSPTLKPNGFGSQVVKTELFFTVVYDTRVCSTEQFAIYMFHGTPAYAGWWKQRRPIVRCATRQEAEEWLDELAGVIDAHKHFETISG